MKIFCHEKSEDKVVHTHINVQEMNIGNISMANVSYVCHSGDPDTICGVSLDWSDVMN